MMFVVIVGFGIGLAYVMWQAGFERTALSMLFPIIAPLMLFDWCRRRGRLTD